MTDNQKLYEELKPLSEEAIEVSDKLIQRLRNFDISVAMNDFIKLSIVVEKIVNLIYLDETLRPYIYDINSVLKNMLEAIENKDYYLVSDIVEYELLPNLHKLTQN
ncbi:hypothetical protein KVG29_04460 [Caldicoprobacter algeriensis]|uniref:hypothetical protein n=1 Tax=Caldicoprobacter algeriensis TaxID=699281 RepID=UPI0020792CE5|nr:hypothetical protein [Caldicoprobacter algeriensis]MCM8900479.1 hypothetical protein [Caldicoprobacter algeriensis]